MDPKVKAAVDASFDVAQAAAILGRKGGKAGRGEAKRRGDSAYYRELRAKQASARKA